jgi:hypothetical protein
LCCLEDSKSLKAVATTSYRRRVLPPCREGVSGSARGRRALDGR